MGPSFKKRDGRHFCGRLISLLILLCVVGLDAQETQGSTIVIDDSNSKEFAKIIADAEKGSIIDIRVDVLEISQTVTLNKSIKLTGGGRNRKPTIRGAPDPPLGFEIDVTERGSPKVTFENLIFTNFAGVMEMRDFDSRNNNKLKVEMVGCSINNNSVTAITMGNNLKLTIQNSDFLDNTQQSRGQSVTGIICKGLQSCEGSTLEVDNCNFKRNIAGNGPGGVILIDGANFVNITKCVFDQNDITYKDGPLSDGFGNVDGSPSERTVFFEFEPPSRTGGAISVVDVLNTEIRSSNFTNNTAGGGGALHSFSRFRQSNLLIEDSNFLYNEAQQGTAGPSAGHSRPGGAVYIIFQETSVSSMAVLKRCTFEGNKAGNGGALHIFGPRKKFLEVINSTFRENAVENAGGAVVVRDCQTDWSNVDFVGNTAKMGGAVMVTNLGNLFMQDAVRFEGNEASQDGGAVFAFGASTILMKVTTFLRNKAERLGGGIWATDPGASDFQLEGAIFEENSALVGGGVYLENMASLKIIPANNGADSGIFKSNRAVSAGGAYIIAQNRAQNRVNVQSVIFEGNVATGLKESEDGSKRKLLQEIAAGTEAAVVESAQNFGQCEPGSGGGLCLEIPAADNVIVQLNNATFNGNEAHVGAGMRVETPPKTTFPVCVRFANPCFHVKAPAFINNTAKQAGGGIFASNPSGFEVTCGSALLDLLSNTKPLTHFRELINDGCKFDGNKVVNGYGPDAASFPKAMKLEEPVNGVVNESLTSGNALPVILISLEDQFNQTMIGLEGVPVRAELDELSGQTLGIVQNGSAEFSTLLVTANPNTYTIEFTVPELEAIKVDFQVRDCIFGEHKQSLSRCFACTSGQFSLNPNQPCKDCPTEAICPGRAGILPRDGFWQPTPFSNIFKRCFPSEACTYPLRNTTLREFYTNNKQSEILCDVGMVNQTEYNQCALGYEGPLCGACVDGYGRDSGGGCIKCRHGTVGSAFILSAFVVLGLGFMGFTLRSNLRSLWDTEKEERERAAPHVQLANAIPEETEGGNPNVVDGHQKAASGKLPAEESIDVTAVTNAPDKPKQDIQPHNPENDGASSSNKSLHNRDPPLGNVQENNEPSSSQSHQLHQTTENECEIGEEGASGNGNGKKDQNGFWSKVVYWTMRILMWGRDMRDVTQVFGEATREDASTYLSETLKILTNFVQLTVTALSVNVRWSEAIKKLLGAEGAVVGLSSGSAFFAMECALAEKTISRKSIEANLLKIFIPIMLIVILAIFFLIKFALKQLNGRYLRSRLIVTGLVGFYVSYMFVSKEAFKVFSCATIDVTSGTPDSLTGECQTKELKYWSEDTNLECFAGPHKRMLIAAIPILVIYIIIIPFSLWGLLLWKNSRVNENGERGLQDRPFRNVWGIWYKAYRGDRYWWELVIILRKVAVSLVVVFVHELSANLQVAIALGVLLAALTLHLGVQPFRFPLLNTLEAQSLFVSSFTFYSAIIFNDNSASSHGKVFLGAFLVITNILLILNLTFWCLVIVDRYMLWRAEKDASSRSEEIPTGFRARWVYIIRNEPKLQKCVKLCRSVTRVTVSCCGFRRTTRPKNENSTRNSTEVGMVSSFRARSQGYINQV